MTRANFVDTFCKIDGRVLWGMQFGVLVQVLFEVLVQVLFEVLVMVRVHFPK